MKKLTAALLGLAVLVGGVSLGALLTFELRPPQVITQAVTAVTPPPERTEVTRDVMVRSLQGKLEMVTASLLLDAYTVAGVCDGNWWQDFAYRNCVTMLIPGKVNAGFNWQQFGPENIETTSETITVNIGTPQIFDVVIDHSKIEVLNQDDGWFVSQDQTLQTRALAQATRELRAKACRNDILTFAAHEAEVRVGNNLRTLLHAAGDTRQVRVIYMPPTCSRSL
jgi:Protein of unknown function (DUF4230)